MMILGLLPFLIAAPQFETFHAPGYQAPVSGVWYKVGEETSAFPLGALGTGYVELASNGAFKQAVQENDWLHPEEVLSGSGLQISVDDSSPLTPSRFWGHFPAADLEYGPEGDPLKVHIRAFAPLVPHDYGLSEMPAALFHLTARNTGGKAHNLRAVLRWPGTNAEVSNQGGTHLALIPASSGTYALGAVGSGWEVSFPGVEDPLREMQASVVLRPGETSEIVLGLAWCFPSWTSSDGELLKHRYSLRYRDAAEVLQAALPRYAEIERKITSWQESIYGSGVPATLKDALLNGLYILPKNSWWLDDDRFFQSESFTGCPITETFVCRFNGSFPLALLWPECEKATMKAVASAQAASGEIPFGFGSPMGSRSPYYHCQHPIVSSEYILNIWRNRVLWEDPAYLKELYPTIEKALRFAMTLDKDGDRLIDEDPGSETGFPANQYYDIWPWWGVSSYSASIWLAALRAVGKMADEMGDSGFAKELEDWFEQGRAAFDEKLWTGEYYRLYNDVAGGRKSDTSLTNALCGEWFAGTCGLGGLLPQDHVNKVIDTVLRLNAKASPFGAVNGVCPDGSVDETFKDHSAVITIGEVWNFCAMAARAGRTEEALELFNRSYENIALLQRTPWNIPWCLDRETGAIKWGINYYSNPCVWTLFQALDEKAYHSLRKRDQPAQPVERQLVWPSERGEYRDEVTGALVHTLTAGPFKDQVVYQTHPMWTPRMEYLVFMSDRGGVWRPNALDMKSGEIRPLAGEGTGGATLARKDDRLYFQEGRNYFWTHVSSAFASHGAAGHIASFPEDVEEVIGLTLDADEETLYAGAVFEKDKRWGVLALDIATGEWRRVVEVDFRVGHVQANPFVPGLVLFCWETGGDSPQRMWVAKTDGSKPVPFYKETYEEWVTHEVWWGPSRVIFTISPYDEEHKKKPHGVVSADLPDGPLNVHSQFHAWHTHGSPDGKWAVADDFARNIWLIQIESGQRRLLTQGHRALKIDNHPHPTFTPDGKSVVFTSSKNGSEDIFMVDIPEWESLPKP